MLLTLLHYISLLCYAVDVLHYVALYGMKQRCLVLMHWSFQKHIHYHQAVFKHLYRQNSVAHHGKSKTIIMSRDMRFLTMWYVRPAKPQISLRSELLLHVVP